MLLRGDHICILGENAFLSRLQRLFPHSPQHPIHITRPGGAAGSENVVPQQSPRKMPALEPKLLKVRILTWNMHDSLPKVRFLSSISINHSNH